MKQKPLTPAMIRELRSIALGGSPSIPAEWTHAPAVLWFWARDKVLTALLNRGLIIDDGEYVLTDAGRAALAALA